MFRLRSGFCHALVGAAIAILCVGESLKAQTASPGHVIYLANADSSLDPYMINPVASLIQWFTAHFTAAIGYPPYFDNRLSWFKNAYAYFDLYGIQQGASEQVRHPDWVLHDQNGNRLYMPFNCDGTSCPLYAADIANPAFRAAWITTTAGTTFHAKYPGVYVDDVNMDFRVSDASGNLATPIDSNTGQPMTYDAWRNYVVTFLKETKAALPGIRIMENTIWYAGPAGVQDADPAIQQQIATADIISLERGVASDTGLTGGKGTFSVFAFLSYIDRVHAAGKGVNFQEYTLDATGQEYGLASYFLISNGSDSIGDASTNPNNWWHGYDVELGNPLGPRTYKNGIFERDFTLGKVLLAEPGLASQTVNLGGTFTTLNGATVTSVTLAGSHGLVLLSTAPADTAINYASLIPGPLSPGEIVSLPLSGASPSPTVLINGATAPIISNSGSQVAAIVPFSLDLSHAAQIQINQGASVSTKTVPVAAVSPGLLTAGTTGTGPGAILNQDFTLNAAGSGAAAGSVIAVYGTGFGTLKSTLADGQIFIGAVATSSPVTATIGGIPARVIYAGSAPGLIAGVIQINILVPSGVTPGPSVPIAVTVGSATTQAGVTVAIQ